MGCIYDIRDEDALISQGWKSYKNSTLKSMTKDDLIDVIRMLEHNWAGEIKANKLQTKRLMFTMEILKKIINNIESYDPEYSELDYDIDDEQVLSYYPLSIEDIIKEILDEVKEKEISLWGNVGFLCRFLNTDEMCYFTEEEQKAEEEFIKKMSIETKNNFYDYYEKEKTENE